MVSLISVPETFIFVTTHLVKASACLQMRYQNLSLICTGGSNNLQHAEKTLRLYSKNWVQLNTNFSNMLRVELSELILRHVPSRPGLHSLNSISLFVPKTISRADKSTADRAFSLSAPKLWNTLPPEIRNTRTIIDFKRKLKTFLFAKYF